MRGSLRKPAAPAGPLIHGWNGRRGDRVEGVLLDGPEDDGSSETRENRKAHALGRIRGVEAALIRSCRAWSSAIGRSGYANNRSSKASAANSREPEPRGALF